MVYDAYVWRALIVLRSGFSNNLDAVPREPPVDFVEENGAAADGGRKQLGEEHDFRCIRIPESR